MFQPNYSTMEVAIMYFIAALSITFGFIALLKQKTYISETTQQPTDVEIKGLGKMKTNYPSLIFVFLGFLCAAFAYYRSSQLKDYSNSVNNLQTQWDSTRRTIQKRLSGQLEVP